MDFAHFGLFWPFLATLDWFAYLSLFDCLFLGEEVLHDTFPAEDVSVVAGDGVDRILEAEMALAEAPLGVLPEAGSGGPVVVFEHLLLGVGEHRVRCVVFGVARHFCG